jgi:uncharacterized protein
MCLHAQLKGAPVNGSQRGKGMRLVICRILITGFRGYQYFISPLFPPACRFVPTCSQYAIDAVTKHGALYGLLLTLWRIARCHPWCRGGYDPVK